MRANNRGNFNRKVTGASIGGCLILFAVMFGLGGVAVPQAQAQGLSKLKIGVVDLNKALNESEKGKSSKKTLLDFQERKKTELKAKENVLKELQQELQTNMMLSNEARASKEQTLRAKEAELRRDVQTAQKELQKRERALTEGIYKDLKAVLEKMGKAEKFDLILESNAAKVILFNSVPFIDLTQKLIGIYNKQKK